MDFDLRKELDFLKDKAKELYLRDGFILPVAFLFSYDENMKKQVYIFPFVLSSQEDKHFILSLLKDAIQRYNAVAVVMILEAYSLRTENESDIERYSGKIHQHPDRQDVIMISAVSRKQHLAYCLSLDKTELNNIKFKEEYVDDISGPFIDLFEPVH